MSYNSQIYDTIKKFLDENDWKYRFDEEKGRILIGINLPGKVRNVRAIVDISYEDSYIVVCALPINAGEQCYAPILRLINYINFGAKFGNYEMDESDGEIRYRITVDCEGITPSDKMIEKSILIPAKMIKDYGEYMIDIIMGYKTFEGVIAELDDKNN